MGTCIVEEEVELVHRVDFHHPGVCGRAGDLQVTVLEQVGAHLVGGDVRSVEELAELVLGYFDGRQGVACLVDEI